MTLDWLWLTLGFRRIANVNRDPPNDLIKEVEPGVFVRPNGVMYTEVILKSTFWGRILFLMSGKIHFVGVVWIASPTVVYGDNVRWEIMPPTDVVDPKLKI